ncbi:hypothetical protein [Noviherbaspirillum saxi]|uniref:Lipoprotein n=1 Tax=Noviherbaspirillum saxi TaxID=2320863 RepID=A0A3A3FPG4_9BURK|nr:hypothetical protein [Noviherbaspirillum saxi]RJF95342.1 hypothetical protein D3871_18090 [Noviherbaspirillum saxi]
MFGKLNGLVTLIILLSGCASTQPIATSDRSNVKAVTLSKDVPVPSKMSYLGPGGATGLAFGAIEAAIAAPGIEKSRESFQEQTTETGVSINRIVYEEALAQIRQSGKFPLKDETEPGGATIYVSVLNYGFSIPHGFSSRLVPILGVRYEMRDPSGRILWSATERVMPLGNPVEPIDVDEIKRNAATREAAWRAAAKALAAKLVANY